MESNLESAPAKGDHLWERWDGQGSVPSTIPSRPVLCGPWLRLVETTHPRRPFLPDVERRGDCKNDCLTLSTFSGVLAVLTAPNLRLTMLPDSWNAIIHERIEFRPGIELRGGIMKRARKARWVATMERPLPKYASTANARCSLVQSMIETGCGGNKNWGPILSDAPPPSFLPSPLAVWRVFQKSKFLCRTLYFEGLDKSYYSDGLKKLENRWIKCIELKGDYVEK